MNEQDKARIIELADSVALNRLVAEYAAEPERRTIATVRAEMASREAFRIAQEAARHA